MPSNYNLCLYRSCNRHMHHIDVGKFKGDGLKKMLHVIRFAIMELLIMPPVTTIEKECVVKGNMSSWGCN